MSARPLSSDGQTGRAPIVGLRLPREQHARLAEIARERGESVSEIGRRAIEREIELANSPPDDD